VYLYPYERGEVPLGGVFDPQTGTVTPAPPVPETPSLPTVSNEALSQQLSDLEANLIIAGVI
jgi:hypothetical protein